MVPLAYILLLRVVGDSFAVAGAVAAAVAIAGGLSAVPQGRLVDRLGQPRVLISFGVLHTATLLALLLAARGGAPPGVLIALAALDGLTIPPLGFDARPVAGADRGRRAARDGVRPRGGAAGGVLHRR